MYPASHYLVLNSKKIECRLCNHFCRLDLEQTGSCRVRHNIDGTLVTSSYSHPIALMVEPIEKKYLFHVLPGAKTLSLGTAGCNLHCDFCINWRISQTAEANSQGTLTPAQVVNRAIQEGASCIAFTYTEPTIFFEYARDIARMAHQANLVVVAKSNGYMSHNALEEMATWLDAINIDLRGWVNTNHNKITGAEVEPILDNLRLVKSLGLWLEITTLIIPGFNDGLDQLKSISTFIAKELGRDTPWHLLRFYPEYKMLYRNATSQDSLQLAANIGTAMELNYIYNKDLDQGRLLDTYCPNCESRIIERDGYNLARNATREGMCSVCGHFLSGIWNNKPNKLIPVSVSAEAIR